MWSRSDSRTPRRTTLSTLPPPKLISCCGDRRAAAVAAVLQDMSDVERRAQAAELRHQELSAKLPEATAPLLRQISALQDASSAQVRAELPQPSAELLVAAGLRRGAHSDCTLPAHA